MRELYRRDHWRFGAEAAFGYTLISISDNRALRNSVYRTNDTFAMNGTIPPTPPYTGTFQGPGPLISSAPSSRTTDLLAGAATITGERDIDSHVFTLRLGPYLEVPLNDKFSAFFNAGLTLGLGYTKFSYNETVVISDPTYDITLSSQRRHASGSETDFLVGAYAGAGLSYALTKEVSLFTSALYQAAGRTTNHEGGKEAILDLGQSIVVAFGVSYSF
jgi:opacity protein-like surface antigen